MQLRLLFVLFLSFFPYAAHAQDKQLLIRGSSTIGPAIRTSVGLFGRENNIRFHIEETGTGTGIQCIKEKTCDLGLASRSLKGEESQGIETHHYGYDGISLALNNATNVSNLTEKQIKEIYTGKIKNWKELGGSDLPIIPLARAANRGVTAVFDSLFKIEPIGEKIDHNLEAINKVRTIKGAIIYISNGAMSKRYDNVTIVTIDGVSPTPENIRMGKYRYVRELLFLVSRERKSDPLLLNLIQFLLKQRDVDFVESGFTK